MRNTFLLAVTAVILATVLGCGVLDRARKEMSGTSVANTDANANKTLTDQAVDSAVGAEKIGIPECDEAIDLLAAQASNPDDNFVTKAAKSLAVSKFRNQVKQSLASNNVNRSDTVKFCRDFTTNLQKSAGSPASNK